MFGIKEPKEIREEIIWLAKNTDKPFFMIGTMEPIYDPNQLHVSFINVRPYAWRCMTKLLCQHINLLRKDVEEHVKVNLDSFGKEFLICVRPMIYYDDETGFERGGLAIDKTVTPEVIVERTLQKYCLSPIPQEKYLDFRNIRNGYYIIREYEDAEKRPEPHHYKAKVEYKEHRKVNLARIINEKNRKRNAGKPSKKEIKEKRDKILWRTMAEADEENFAY